MHAMLLFGGLSGLVAALLLIRKRQPPGLGSLARAATRVDGWTGRTLAVASAVLLVAAPFERTRELFGFGFPPLCESKPASDVDDPGTLPGPDEALQAEAQQDQLDADQPDPVVEIGETEVLQQLTGPGLSDVPWGVWGTDLGHPFVLGDRIGLLFGDTFGSAARDGWRSNVLAWAHRTGPDELVIDEWRAFGGGRQWADELLGSLKLNGWEQTVIPTNATTVDGDIVVHYMSVQCWGVHGSWVVNGAGLAVSRDEGRTFHRLMPRPWGPDSGFAQVAFVGDGQVRHVLGIPSGRDGPVLLARTDERTLTDVSTWEYWDGQGWSDRFADARPIVPAPVGELSVQFNPLLEAWVMLYLHDTRGAIVLRTADELTGPWTAPTTVVTGADLPELYAPYLLPPADEDGMLRYTLSRFDIYNVLHVRTAVTRVDES